MKTVFFINKSNGFPKQMINFMVENFPDESMDFYVYAQPSEEELPDRDNVHRLLSLKEYLFNRELRQNLKNADKVIVSGVGTVRYFLPFMGKKIINKTLFQFWGRDYEAFHNDGKRGLAQRLKYRLVQYLLDNSAGIILLTKEEQNNFEETFPRNGRKVLFYVIVPSDGHRNVVVDQVLQEMEHTDCRCENHRIVIGNSATISNHHREIFDRLRAVDIGNTDIYCPLSYGDMNYRDQVIGWGRDCFGDRFHPITDYMNYDDYIRFLASCDVAMYDLDRQQALGNIYLMLDLGKKVYATPIICDNVAAYGYRSYSVRDLPNTIEEILEFSLADRDNNLCGRRHRDQEIYNVWKEILEYRV